jgi:hypothetical protein
MRCEVLYQPFTGAFNMNSLSALNTAFVSFDIPPSLPPHAPVIA